MCATNLFAQRTALIGREEALEQLDRLLAGAQRLVTVLGPGGVGKTRLARELGRRWLASGACGEAWFAALQEERDGDGIAAAVAAALGVPAGAAAAGADLVQLLAVALAAKGRVLLILDNFEHLTPWAEQTVGRWLDRVPELRVLATSRQALAIRGEQRFELRPLGVDAAHALFVARARSVRPELALAPDREACIRELNARLDHLPLAIELAAARCAVLSPEEIRARLAARFELLQDPGRENPRHATLRAALDWSWSLLAEDERAALCACALFSGGVSLDALGAVLGGDDEALRLAQALREKSLLTAEDHVEGAATRVAMLQNVREHARQQLAQREDRELLQRRFAQYFLSFAETRAAAARGPDAAAALRALRDETGNLLAAQRFAKDSDPAGSVRLALAANAALAIAGPHVVQRALLADAVATAEQHGPAELLLRALLARGDASVVRGERTAAELDLERALQLARQHALTACEADALRLLGILRRDAGDFDAGRALLEAAAALAQRLGDRALLALVTGSIGTLYRQQGRTRAARAAYERTVELHRELGDRAGEGLILAGLGHLEAAEGEIKTALARYAEALALLIAAGERRTAGIVSDRMGMLAHLEGDPERALALLHDAVAHLRAVGDELHAELARLHAAAVLAFADRLALARETFAAAQRALGRAADPRVRISVRAVEACLWCAEARGRQPRDAARPAALRRRARNVARRLDGDEAIGEEYVGQARRLLAHALDADAPAAEQARGAAAERSTGAEQVTVGPGGSWVALPSGARVELQRHGVLARLVEVLARQRVEHPGQPLAAQALIPLVWKGTAATDPGAARRLYVAVTRLRQQGLGTLLVRHAGGYLLNPAVVCVMSQG